MYAVIFTNTKNVLETFPTKEAAKMYRRKAIERIAHAETGEVIGKMMNVYSPEQIANPNFIQDNVNDIFNRAVELL